MSPKYGSGRQSQSKSGQGRAVGGRGGGGGEAHTIPSVGARSSSNNSSSKCKLLSITIPPMTIMAKGPLSQPQRSFSLLPKSIHHPILLGQRLSNDDDEDDNNGNVGIIHGMNDLAEGRSADSGTQPSQPLILQHLLPPVHCELCREKRNAIADSSREPLTCTTMREEGLQCRVSFGMFVPLSSISIFEW